MRKVAERLSPCHLCLRGLFQIKYVADKVFFIDIQHILELVVKKLFSISEEMFVSHMKFLALAFSFLLVSPYRFNHQYQSTMITAIEQFLELLSAQIVIGNPFEVFVRDRSYEVTNFFFGENSADFS